jgi:hypothetical protein
MASVMPGVSGFKPIAVSNTIPELPKESSGQIVKEEQQTLKKNSTKGLSSKLNDCEIEAIMTPFTPANLSPTLPNRSPSIHIFVVNNIPV